MKGRQYSQLRSGADEPLDLILGRGSEWPLDLAGLLQVEVGLATALSDLRQRGLNTERRQAWNAGRRHRTYEYCLPFMAGQSEELRHTR